jgi:hypothetical protein
MTSIMKLAIVALALVVFGSGVGIATAGTKNGEDHQGRHGGPPDHSNNGGNNSGPGDT